MDSAALIDKADSLRRQHGGRAWTECKGLLTRAVDLARKSGDPAVLSCALSAMGRIERDHDGKNPAVMALYQEAADVARTARADLQLAHALRHLGELKREAGDAALALSMHQECLALYRAASAGPLEQGNALRGVGLDQEALGDPKAALMAWEEAGDLYAEFCRAQDPPWDVSTFSGVIEAKERLKALEA